MSGIGMCFVARKTVQRLQMVYEEQGCQSDERSRPGSDAGPFRINYRSNSTKQGGADVNLDCIGAVVCDTLKGPSMNRGVHDLFFGRAGSVELGHDAS